MNIPTKFQGFASAPHEAMQSDKYSDTLSLGNHCYVKIDETHHESRHNGIPRSGTLVIPTENQPVGWLWWW